MLMRLLVLALVAKVLSAPGDHEDESLVGAGGDTPNPGVTGQCLITEQPGESANRRSGLNETRHYDDEVDGPAYGVTVEADGDVQPRKSRLARAFWMFKSCFIGGGPSQT